MLPLAVRMLRHFPYGSFHFLIFSPSRPTLLCYSSYRVVPTVCMTSFNPPSPNMITSRYWFGCGAGRMTDITFLYTRICLQRHVGQLPAKMLLTLFTGWFYIKLDFIFKSDDHKSTNQHWAAMGKGMEVSAVTYAGCVSLLLAPPMYFTVWCGSS